jgi:hypothetical protein
MGSLSIVWDTLWTHLPHQAKEIPLMEVSLVDSLAPELSLAPVEGTGTRLDCVKLARSIFGVVSVSATPLEAPDDWERNCKVSNLDPDGAMFVTLSVCQSLEWLAHWDLALTE